MRELVFGLLAVSGVGAGVFLWPAAGGSLPDGAYPLSPTEAVERLTSAPTKTGTSPFYKLDIVATISSSNTVKFMTKDEGRVLCQVGLQEVEGGVKAVPSCGEKLEGNAIGNTTVKLQEDGFLEFVDAALEGRAFNKAAVSARTMGTVMGNMPAMQKQALDTQREFQQLEADIESGREPPTADFGDGSFAEEPSDDYYE